MQLPTFLEHLYLMEAEEHNIPADKGTIVFASGNMNPPTKGHLALAQYVVAKARELGAPAKLFITKSHKGHGLLKKDSELAGKLYRGDPTTKVAVSNARSPLSPTEKIEFARRLFNEMNKLDISIEQTTNPQVALGELLRDGYTNIIYLAGSEYFEDPKDAAMLARMEQFVYETVNPGRKELDSNAPMVNFKAVPIERDPTATSGTSSFKGSKARKAILGHLANEYDEPEGRKQYGQQSGWNSNDDEKKISDEMFDAVRKNYRGS